jgi:hypothetical protein
MSLRWRVSLLGMGVVVLVLCCFSASLFALMSRGIGADRDKQLQERADAAVVSMAAAGADALSPFVVLAPVDAGTSVDIFLMVTDEDGVVAFSTGEVAGAPPKIPVSTLASAARDGDAVTVVASGQSLRVAVRPWKRTDPDRRSRWAGAGTASPPASPGTGSWSTYSGPFVPNSLRRMSQREIRVDWGTERYQAVNWAETIERWIHTRTRRSAPRRTTPGPPGPDLL